MPLITALKTNTGTHPIIPITLDTYRKFWVAVAPHKEVTPSE